MQGPALIQHSCVTLSQAAEKEPGESQHTDKRGEITVSGRDAEMGLFTELKSFKKENTCRESIESLTNKQTNKKLCSLGLVRN